MKFAVISDIHGNMEALNAVMENIEKSNCEKIFALGDYAMAGAEPDVAIDWIMENQAKKNLTLIQGNTDKMIVEYSPTLYEDLKENSPVMAEALRYDYQNINPIQRAFLKDLPPQAEAEIQGVKFLFVHGSPRRNNEDIMPDTPIEEVQKMVEGINANIVLCGHTHIPCGFQTNKQQTVVNVGSVGRSMFEDGKACYLEITVHNGQCLFEHKFIEYDRETTVAKLKKRKFVGVEKIISAILKPEERHF
ncbi:MAG: metallophosphatase family protein [bacterium]|nr:metallophosphatase family protein [bacterium]